MGPLKNISKDADPCFLRIMANCLLGLVGIYTTVATAGRWMREEEVAELQRCYFLWRYSYNRPMVGFVVHALHGLLFGIMLSFVGPASARGLATMALERQQLMWPLRPKQHQVEHMRLGFKHGQIDGNTENASDSESFQTLSDLRCLDLAPKRGNPRHWSCHLDEDLVGRLKNTVQHCHAATFGLRALQHYMCFASLRWLGEKVLC